MNGPITRPTIYDDAIVKRLVYEGHSVYERLNDGTNKRLTRADYETAEATTNTVEVPEVKPVSVKTEVIEDVVAPIDGGKVFTGVSATTAPVMPEKEDNTPSTASLTKAQRKAQKKARLEAARAEAEEATTETTEEVDE